MKMFFSDLDGTLIDVEGNIQEKDLLAIKELKKHGIGFGIVTGRDYGFCQKLIQRYALPECDIIGNNGGSIWVKGEKIMEEHMDPKSVWCIMELLKEHLDELNPFICDESSVFYFMCHHYPPGKWKEVRKLLSYLGNLSDKDLLDYLKENKDPIVKLSIHTYTAECTEKWLPILKEAFGAMYEIQPTSFDYIEITCKGINKGKSFLQLLDRLNVDASEAIVIGDGVNDLSLFHEAGYSYAMASAPEEVKQEADAIVDSVAEAIEQLLQK